MEKFIEKLRNSGNKLLETEAADIAQWSKLKHNKSDLELFLNFNIAEIQFTTKDGNESTVVCTSNTTLMNMFSLVKENDVKKAAKVKSKGMKSSKNGEVLAWDLIDNKPKTISLKSWQIMNFITISPENILVLDKTIKKLLKK